jgi:hypothetical protein
MDLTRLFYFAGMDDICYVEFPDTSVTPEEGCLAFSELIVKFRWLFQIKIALLPDDSQELSQRLRTLENVMVVSYADLRRVAESKNVTLPLRELFLSQLNPNRLVGYQYNGAVTGNRFFGREAQLASIIQRPDISYLVTGTRMSGKTSLLMQAKRRLDEVHLLYSNDRPNTIYIDCKRYSTFAGLINAILTEMEERSSLSNIDRWESPQRWHAFYAYLRNYAKNRPDKRLHIFLDEYDQVLEIEKIGAPNITWNFRALRQDNWKGTIQFVFAGSKYLAIEAAQKKSSFFNFVEGCRLDNFDLGTINLLLRQPMEELGFDIVDPALIAQELLHESSGRPSSVQFICYHIAKNLLMNKRKQVTISELRKVVQGPQYLHYYDVILHENTDVLQRFILSTQCRGNARRTSFSRDDILSELRKFGVYLDTSKLIHSLSDLVNSGFLEFDERATDELKYVLSAPVIKRLFGRSPPEMLVELMVNQGTAFRLDSAGDK